MHPKFLKACLVGALLTISHTATSGGEASVWNSSPVGHCYSNVDEYMEKTFGKNFRDDENIKDYPFEPGNLANEKGRFVWVEDATPSVNTTRTLFRISRTERACAILYAPFSSSIRLYPRKNGWLPSQIESSDTPPPGLKTRLIKHVLDKNRGIYLPKNCFHVSASGKKKQMSCDKVFKE